MSIYATLWKLKFPCDGDYFIGNGWIEVTAQGVPAHIGTPTLGYGYEKGDPYAAFLPPPLEVDSEGDAPYMRAVVFVTEGKVKGTDRSPQEYEGPLLVITGQEYKRITFSELYDRICNALRGNRGPIVMEIIQPDGSTQIIRQQR